MMNSTEAVREETPMDPSLQREMIPLLRYRSIKMRKSRSLRIADLGIGRSPRKQGKDRIKRSNLNGVTLRKSSLQKKMDGRAPNYMNPTSCSDKKKESTEVRTHLSTTKNNQNRLRLKNGIEKTTVTSRLGKNPKEITKKSLSRCISLRPKKPLTKVPGIPLLVVQDATRATCSSTLKDSKFPDYVTLHPGGTESEGTSAMKICPYTYCSLNGHFHKPLPPLKRFLSTKRRSVKAQKSMKSRGNKGCKTKLLLKSKSKTHLGHNLVIQGTSNGEATSPSWCSRSSDGERNDFLTGNSYDDFFVEIYANSLPDITYCDHPENAGPVENNAVEAPQSVLDMKDFGKSSYHNYEEVYLGWRQREAEQEVDDCLQEAESMLNSSSCESNTASDEDSEQDQSIDFFIEHKDYTYASQVVPRFSDQGKQDDGPNNCPISDDQLAMKSEICLASKASEDELVSVLCAQEMEGTHETPKNVLSSSSDICCDMKRASQNMSTCDCAEDNISSDAEILLEESHTCQKNDSSPAQEPTGPCETLELDIPVTQDSDMNIAGRRQTAEMTDVEDLMPGNLSLCDTGIPSYSSNDADDSKFPEGDQSDPRNVEDTETRQDCLLGAPRNVFSCESSIHNDKDDGDQQSSLLEYAQVVNASLLIEGNNCDMREESGCSSESCGTLKTDEPSSFSNMCIESESGSVFSPSELHEDFGPSSNKGSSGTVIFDDEPDNQNTVLNTTLIGGEMERNDYNFSREISSHMCNEREGSPSEDSSDLSGRLVLDISTSPNSEILYHAHELLMPDAQACRDIGAPKEDMSGMFEVDVTNKEKIICAPNLVSAFTKGIEEERRKSSLPGDILEAQIHNPVMLICGEKDKIDTEIENLEDAENDTESRKYDAEKEKEKDCYDVMDCQPDQVNCRRSTSDEGSSSFVRKAVDIKVSPEENEIKPSGLSSSSYNPSSEMQFGVVTTGTAEQPFLAATIKHLTKNNPKYLPSDAGKGNENTRLYVMVGQQAKPKSHSLEVDEGNSDTKTVNVHVPMEENNTRPSNSAKESYIYPQEGVERGGKLDSSVQGSEKSANLPQFRDDTKQDTLKPFPSFRSKHLADIDTESPESDAANKNANNILEVLCGQRIQVECCASSSQEVNCAQKTVAVKVSEEVNCARKTVDVNLSSQGANMTQSDSHGGGYTLKESHEKRKQHISLDEDSFGKATKAKFRVHENQDKEEPFLADKINHPDKAENKPMDEKAWSLLFSRCRSNLREITNFESIDDYDDTTKEEKHVIPSPITKLRLSRCYSDSKHRRNSKGKDMIEVMSGSRKINPRKPNFLPIPPWPLRENVVLRSRPIDQRKSSEEFMLDYALRQTVNKLAPARKKRVAMLVEAFEKVMPSPKCKPYPHHHEATHSRVRTVHLCS